MTPEALAVEVLAIDVVVEVLLALEHLPAQFACVDARSVSRVIPSGTPAELLHRALAESLLQRGAHHLLGIGRTIASVSMELYNIHYRHRWNGTRALLRLERTMYLLCH